MTSNKETPEGAENAEVSLDQVAATSEVFADVEDTEMLVEVKVDGLIELIICNEQMVTNVFMHVDEVRELRARLNNAINEASLTDSPGEEIVDEE